MSVGLVQNLAPNRQQPPSFVNALSRMYNPDGGTTTYGGGIICFHARVRHVVQHAGWFYGFTYINGTGGTNGASETVGEIPTGNSMTVRSSVETSDGTIYPLYRNGTREPVLISGESADFRLLNGGAIYLAKGDIVYSRTKFLLASAAHLIPRYSRYCYWDGQSTSGDYFRAGDTSDVNYTDTAATSWPASSDDAPAAGANPPAMIGPAAALMVLSGEKIQPVVEVWGTSRQEDWPIARGTTLVDASGVYGRALSALGLPYISCHRGSARGYWEIKTANSLFRNGLAAGASIAVWAHGINDSNVGRTLTQMQTDIKTFCTRKRAEGKVVIATTEYPRTTSTDAWETVGNQAIPNAGYEAVRVAWNNWVRGLLTDAQITAAGGDPTILRGQCFDDWIEVADTIESSRDSGRFRAGTSLYSGTATAGATTSLTRTGAGWTAGAFHDCLVIITGGTGAGQVRQILQNTTEILYPGAAFSPAPDNTSTFKVIEAMVGASDATGIHASQAARALMAAAVQTHMAKYVR